jgi:hypothetical protein
MDERLAATITALAEKLCDRCLRPQLPGDGEVARQPLLALANQEVSSELLMVATGDRPTPAHRSYSRHRY